MSQRIEGIRVDNNVLITSKQGEKGPYNLRQSNMVKLSHVSEYLVTLRPNVNLGRIKFTSLEYETNIIVVKEKFLLNI